MKFKKKKLSDKAILVIGIVIFLFFLLLPEPGSPWMISTMDVIVSRDCFAFSTLPTIACKLSQGLGVNLVYAANASSILKGRGSASDIAQDIVGFRALVSHQDPYPILAPAYRKIGLEWGVVLNASTHPPMAFLLVAPIAFLPWVWASTAWAWFMLVLIVFTFRCYGVSWKAAIGLTPIALLWPPVFSSLGQLTIIWLFALAAGYHFERKQQFWSGTLIGLAAITKFFPGIMVIFFLLKRKWLALLGFVATFVASLLIVILLRPGSISRYIEVNQSNSIAFMQASENSSLLINSYRFGGWIGVTLVLLLFLAIIWANKDCFYNSQFSSSPKLWRLLSYFSVALLPISWLYSITPLLPIVIGLISRKKLSTLIIGCCCIAIPCIVPVFSAPAPLALVMFLIGLGLLFDALPFKLFTAQNLRQIGGMKQGFSSKVAVFDNPAEK